VIPSGFFGSIQVRRIRVVRLILNILLLVVLVVFIAINMAYRTTVNFFGLMLEDVSVVAVVLVSIVFGIVYSFVTYLINFFVRKRRARLNRRREQTKEKERELKEKEKELALPPSEQDR
jgi:uncharacterized integral membrane protein